MEFSLVFRWPRDKFSKIYKRKKIMNRKIRHLQGGHNIDQVVRMYHKVRVISWRMGQLDHPVLNIIKVHCQEFIKCKSREKKSLLTYSLQIKVLIMEWGNRHSHHHSHLGTSRKMLNCLTLEVVMLLLNNPSNKANHQSTKTSHKTLITSSKVIISFKTTTTSTPTMTQTSQPFNKTSTATTTGVTMISQWSPIEVLLVQVVQV